MTVEIPEAERIPAGTRVRVTQEDGAHDAEVGREYLIQAYVSADEGDAEPPEPYYWMESAPGQGGWWTSDAFAMHRALEVVMAAEEQQRLMVPPTAEELVALIADGLIQAREDDLEIIETNEVKTAPKGADAGFEGGEHGFAYGVEFYGRRRNGKGFGAVVRVTGYWPTDD